MATYTIAPNVARQLLDNDANPGAGFFLYIYEAGTLVEAVVYQTDAGTPWTQPITLNSAGRITGSQELFLTPGISYDFELKDADGVTVWTKPGIMGTPLPSPSEVPGTAGENIPANSSVYLSKGDGARTAGRWYLTDADLAYASSLAEEVGWAATAILSGATGVIQLTGIVTTASPVLAGTKYYASATAGAITSTAPINQRVVGVTNSVQTLVLGEADQWTARAVPLLTANQPTAADAGAGAIIQRTDGIRGLWVSTGAVVYSLNGGAIPGGAFDLVGDDTADNAVQLAAIVAAVPTDGGVIELPAGEFFTSDLITLDKDFTILRGKGVGLTTIRSTDTTGAILIEGRFCGLENLTVLYEGAGSYGVRIDNSTTVINTGADRPTLTNVKIKGATGTANGLWIVNSSHGTYTNLYLPCGGAKAILMEASGFCQFSDVQITPNLGEGSPAWVDGVVLQRLTDILNFQSDDNTFTNLNVAGVTRHGIHITSTIASGPFAGLPPARNCFFGGSSQGNTTTDVYIENGLDNRFYGMHTETATKNFHIAGNVGNHVNKFFGCSGQFDIDNPGSAQGIQGTLLYAHSGNLTIGGANVFGTQAIGLTGTLVDDGTNSLTFQSLLATSPNAATSYRFNGRVFTYGPVAPVNAVQGSGGAAVTIIALPANSYGVIYVRGTHDTLNDLAYYEIQYVNGSVAAIHGTPRAVVAGTTEAQMTFSLSGANLQAIGVNATPPATVTLWADYFEY